MNSTIEQRAAKNTFVGIVSYIVSFLQSILIVPLILSIWGTIKYGNWIALFAGFTLLQTIDLGHQSYIGNEINVLYHKSKTELQRVLSSSMIIAWMIGFFELLVTIYLITSGTLIVFLGVEVQEYQLSAALLTLIIMWFIFGSVSGILIRLLVPLGKFYEQQWISIIIRFLQFIGLLIVVIMHGSILTAAIIYSVLQSVLTILVLIYLKRILPEFYPWWKNGNFKFAVNNFLKSIVLTVNSIINQLTVNGLIIFVTNYYQIVQVPVFTTIRTLTNTAGGVTNIIISALSPDIVKYHSKGEDDKLFLTLTTNLFLSGLIVNTALILSTFFIEPLYALWTNYQLSFNRSLFLFLAAGISFSNFGIGIINYFYSINKLNEYSIIIFSKGLTLFITAYLFISIKDLKTIGLSVALSELVSSVVLPLYLINKAKPKFLRQGRLKYFSLSFVPPLLIFCLAFFADYNSISSLLNLIAFLVVLICYYLNWQMIETEVKQRIKLTITKYIKIKWFNK